MKKYSIVLILLLLFSCKKTEDKLQAGKLHVVTTTSQVTDLVKAIAGNSVVVEGLMGAGVDPHLYKASEGDVAKFYNADVIFYNGLHLEGKLEEVFEKMRHQNKKTIAVADALDKGELIASEDFASSYDPHFWFSIPNWKKAANYVASQLKNIDAKNAAIYEENLKNYIKQLTSLMLTIENQLSQLPKKQRVLVTAHDAFAYFGQSHDFNVVSLQGLSTATEAGVKDVQRITEFIITHKVKAIFVESSVPVRTVEALQAAVRAKKHEVVIGGTLFSDALGNPDTKEGTYIGMYEYNIQTIINALK